MTKSLLILRAVLVPGSAESGSVGRFVWALMSGSMYYFHPVLRVETLRRERGRRRKRAVEADDEKLVGLRQRW